MLKPDSNSKLLWIAKDWDNDAFRSFVNEFIKENTIGRIVYNKRNSLIHIKSNIHKGIEEDIIAKEFRLKRKYDQLRFCFLNSKAVRSLKIALALEEISIKTPKPVAIIEKRGKFNKILYSYFITEYIDYDYNLLDIVKDSNHPLREEVINFLPQIAQSISKIHEAGIVHNDLHAGNILVHNIAKNPEFYYIDLNRGRIKKELSIKVRLKDLSRFKLNKDEWEVFMKNYAPNKHKDLLSLMLRQRERRKRFLQLKRRLKRICGKVKYKL